MKRVFVQFSAAVDHQGHAFDALENAVHEVKKNIMSNVKTWKEKANMFREEIRKLDNI